MSAYKMRPAIVYKPRRQTRSLFQLLRGLFAERHIILKDGARLNYLRLTPPLQIFLASILLGITIWVSYSSATVFLKAKLIAAKEQTHQHVVADYENRLAKMQTSYTQLNNKLVDVQEGILNATLSLHTRQEQLYEMLEGENQPGTRNLTERIIEENQNPAETFLNVPFPLSLTTENGNRLVMSLRKASGPPLYSRSSPPETGNETFGKLWPAQQAGRDSDYSKSNPLETEITSLMIAELWSRDRFQAADTHIDLLNVEQVAIASKLEEHLEDEIHGLESIIIATGMPVRTKSGVPTPTMDESLSQPRLAGVGGPFIASFLAEDTTTFQAENRLGTESRHANEAPWLRQIDRLSHHIQYLTELRRQVNKTPLIAPLNTYAITSHFGIRRDPFTKRPAIHNGIDLRAAYGEPVLAPAPGRVVFAGFWGHYGRAIHIDHGNGLRTRYGHLKKINVKRGDILETRDIIGLVGSSGRSTGPHLHYEIRYYNKPFNPWNFLLAGHDVFFSQQTKNPPDLFLARSGQH